MVQAFEARFKTPSDENSLLIQLTQLKKEMHERMREFVANFNKILERIPVNSRPNARNQKSFFLGAMPLDISFQMRRNVLADLATAQTMAIELEDDLIIVGKWRKDV